MICLLFSPQNLVTADHCDMNRKITIGDAVYLITLLNLAN